MTLDTRIYVHGPVDHREAFEKFNHLIGADEGTRFSDKQDETYRAGEWAVFPDSPWAWVNEFTGETHWGYEGLTELGTGGLAALKWFAAEVLPAIAAKMSEEQQP